MVFFMFVGVCVCVQRRKHEANRQIYGMNAEQIEMRMKMS